MADAWIAAGCQAAAFVGVLAFVREPRYRS